MFIRTFPPRLPLFCYPHSCPFDCNCYELLLLRLPVIATPRRHQQPAASARLPIHVHHIVQLDSEAKEGGTPGYGTFIVVGVQSNTAAGRPNTSSHVLPSISIAINGWRRAKSTWCLSISGGDGICKGTSAAHVLCNSATAIDPNVARESQHTFTVG